MKISLASAMLISFAVFAEGKRGGDKTCSYETAADAKADGEWIKGALWTCCGLNDADWCAKELEWTGDCEAEVLEEGEKWNPAQMYNCCKVEEGEEKPDWCKKDDGEKGTSSDEGESSETSGDEKGGNKARRAAFIDEM